MQFMNIYAYLWSINIPVHVFGSILFFHKLMSRIQSDKTDMIELFISRNSANWANVNSLKVGKSARTHASSIRVCNISDGFVTLFRCRHGLGLGFRSCNFYWFQYAKCMTWFCFCCRYRLWYFLPVWTEIILREDRKR